MSSGKSITVALDYDLARGVDLWLATGKYDSVGELLQAALRALEREERALSQIMGDKVCLAFASSGPDADANEVFARLRAHHAEVVLEPIDSETISWALIDQTGDSPFMPDGREQTPVPADRERK